MAFFAGVRAFLMRRAGAKALPNGNRQRNFKEEKGAWTRPKADGGSNPQGLTPHRVCRTRRNAPAEASFNASIVRFIESIDLFIGHIVLLFHFLYDMRYFVAP